MRVNCLVLPLLFVLPLQQTPVFDPFAGSAASYHFDLARNFFASPAREAEARAELLRRLERLRTMAPTAVRSAPAFLQALRLQDSLQREIGKHLAYWSLRTVTNTADASAQRISNEIGMAVAPGYRAMDIVIARTPRASIDQLRRSLPALERYAYYIDQVYRTAQRQPSAQNTSAINALTSELNWGPDLFQRTLATIDFGTLSTRERRFDLRTEGSAIRSHPDRAVRAEGFRRNQAALSTRLDTFALILTRTAETRNRLAKLRGFNDYAEESYEERLLTRREVSDLLARIAGHAQTNRAYETLRRNRIKQALGYADVHWWDMTAPIGTSAPRFTIQQASAAVIAAAQPVGATYVEELRALLDPRNGRLDIAPGPNRVDRPGFATGLVGYPSTFYQGRFTGYVDDVVILAHEAGHAVQNMLMDRQGVLPRYANGPGFFTESFGVFAEFITLRHLYRSEPDRVRKIFYLERLLDQAIGMFSNAAEAAVEQAIYDSISVGRRLDAKSIESLMQNVGSRYSSWFGPGSERELAWLQPIQFYTRPLYRLNYVYARVLALAYVDLLETDARSFAPRFNQLLSRGYDAPTDTLLQRTVGLKLTDPALVQRAASVIAKWTAELQALYRGS